MVTGSIHHTKWTDHNGTERYGCEIIAEQVDFLVKTERGEPQFASGDRIMFLRNERDLRAKWP